MWENKNLIKNKYYKFYISLIEKRKNNPLIKSKELYIESHHIIPKSLGGLDDKENLIRLTAREHFMAHAFLSKMFVEGSGELAKMRLALGSMTRVCENKQERLKFTKSKIFEYNKIKLLDVYKNRKKLNNGEITIWVYDDETYNEYISKGWKRGLTDEVINSRRGENCNWYNIPRTQEQKNIQSENMRGRIKINNDSEELTIKKEFLNEYLEKGWKLGRCDKNKKKLQGSLNPSYGKKWMYKGEERVYVKKEEVEKYLKLGYELGLVKNYKPSTEALRKLSEYSKNCKRMNNGIENRNIHRDKVEEYLSLGYKFGYIKH